MNEGLPPQPAPDEVAPTWRLRLYVAGHTARGEAARRNLEAICQRFLGGQWDIEVVDLSAEPGRATEDRIIALPTVVRLRPAPVRRVVGDLSLSDRVLRGLGLSPTPP